MHAAFWEGWDLPRGTAPFSGAGPPRQGGMCRAARSSAIGVSPSMGGDGCLSLLHLPLCARFPLPAPGQGCLGEAAGTSSLSWATARVKPHATATRPATGKLDRLGWVLGGGKKWCSARGSVALGSLLWDLLWARDIPTRKGAVTQRSSCHM